MFFESYNLNTNVLTCNYILFISVKPIQPSVTGDLEVLDDASVTLTCDYTGSTLPAGTTYKWKKDKTDLLGEATSTFTINPADFESAATYSCLITVNSVDSVDSAGHALTGKSN